MTGTADLTGLWLGSYDYPLQLGPTTFFSARLQGEGGGFTGLSREEDPFGSGTLTASLSGYVAGTDVVFTKAYQGTADEAYSELIDYRGALSEDGNAIAGSWILPGYAGAFRMRRRPQKQERAVEQDSEVSVRA